MLMLESRLGVPNPQWNRRFPRGRKPPVTLLSGVLVSSCAPAPGRSPGRLSCSSGWPRPAFLQVLPEKPLEANLPAENFLFQNNEG